MSSQENFLYYQRKIEKTHDKTDEEDEIIDHLKGIDVKHNQRPYPKSKVLNDKMVESDELEKKLYEQQKAHAKLRAQNDSLYIDKKGPGIVTNYNKQVNPKTGCIKVVKSRNDADFDKKYYEREQTKNEGLNKLEEKKWNEEQEVCTFAPQIDANSKKIAKDQLTLKPLQDRYAQEVKQRKDKILEMKKQFAQEKEYEEDKAMLKDEKQQNKYRLNKKDVHETNHFWYENKEKKVFEAKMQAYDRVTEGCNFEPKLNIDFNNTLELGDFLERQNNHLRRIEKKTQTVLENIEPYSFIPKLNPKSLNMAKHKKKFSKATRGHNCYEYNDENVIGGNYATRPTDSMNFDKPRFTGINEKDTTTKKRRNPEAFERLTRPKSKRPALAVVNLPTGKNAGLLNLNDTEGLPDEYQEYLKHQDNIKNDKNNLLQENINQIEVDQIPLFMSR